MCGRLASSVWLESNIFNLPKIIGEFPDTRLIDQFLESLTAHAERKAGGSYVTVAFHTLSLSRKTPEKPNPVIHLCNIFGKGLKREAASIFRQPTIVQPLRRTLDNKEFNAKYLSAEFMV